MSNRSARRCYHAGPITEAGPEASADLKLSSSTRYLRLARIIVRLPMYARIVWGLMRDPRTPAGLKGMLAAALKQPIPLECDEVVMHGAGGRETDRIRDLPHRGRIAALLDRAGDEVDDSLATLDVMPCHCRKP